MSVKVFLKKTLEAFTMALGFVIVAIMIFHSVKTIEYEKMLASAVEIDADTETSAESDIDSFNQTISFPVCQDINVTLGSKTNDFSYSNPETNDCYIRVSITRLDTNETIFQSSSMSPGKSISNISFSPDFKYPGTYDVRIKIDAHAIDRMKYLNGIVVNKKIIVN